MSRVGLKPIKVPAGVTVAYADGVATVKGPKGEIKKQLPHFCEIKQEDGVINIVRPSDSGLHRRMHGLTRALLNNMVVGVSEGFNKELEIVGVGYKAEMKGKDLVLSLGFSHPINFAVPEGLTIDCPEPTRIRVSGIEKDKVGQAAADIRGFRPPEPYKGKGVKYIGETIKRKAGKTAVGGS